ncbi:MAG TPA: hypothetical protein V6D14_17905 [Coleofasciculaceae cyanobacterium]
MVYLNRVDNHAANTSLQQTAGLGFGCAVCSRLSAVGDLCR